MAEGNCKYNARIVYEILTFSTNLCSRPPLNPGMQVILISLDFRVFKEQFFTESGKSMEGKESK